MAGKRSSIPAKLAALAEIDFDKPTSEIDFDTFMEDIGESASTVEIYRMVRAEREQLDKITLDEIRTDVYGYLRERFGVGKYWLKFKSGDQKYRGSKTIMIGSQAKVDATPAPPLPAPAPVDSVYKEQLALQQTLLITLLGSMKGPDMGAMMQGIAAMVGAAMGGSPRTDPAAMLTAVTSAFNTINGGGAKKEDDDWLDRMEKTVTIVRGLLPDNNHSDSWLGVVRDVGKEAINKLAVPSMLQLPPAPAATADTAAAVSTVKTIGEGSPVLGMGKTYADNVREGLMILKDKARAERDPGLFVDLLFEESDLPHWSAILKAIHSGASFDNLLQFDPEIAQNAELTAWFRVVFDGLHSGLFYDVDSSRKGGNAGDTPNNAGASTEGQTPS